MANCDYERQIPIAVCVDGEVGPQPNGTVASANLGVQINDSAIVNPSPKTLTQNNWNGSSTTFNGWVDMFFFENCNVDASSMTVTLGPGNNQVTIDISIDVSDCSGSTTYSQCGGPGPHTFTDSKTYPLVVGNPCPFAVGP